MQATAFKVFQLKPPTPEQPFIKGLLDPCTNSLLAPNIPAEKLYDKEVRHNTNVNAAQPGSGQVASVHLFVHFLHSNKLFQVIPV